jgi:type IV pilus assembly protein PilX
MIARACRRRHDGGAALVVSLLLLSLLTLLAISGITAASLELRMAGNEQYQERAFQAADAGIERAIRAGVYDTGSTIGTYSPPGRPGFAPTPQRGTGVRGCVRTVDDTGSARDTGDCYEYFMRYDAPTGATPVPDDLGLEPEFLAYHFVVDAYGSSSRQAESHHVQGFYVVGTSPPGPPPTCPSEPESCGTGLAHPPVRTYWREGGS